MKLTAMPLSCTIVMTALALTGSIASRTFASESTDKVAEQLNSALIVEWAMGHCDQSQIPGMAITISAMTINGAEAETVEKLRQDLKARVSAHYPDAASACAALVKAFKAGPN